MLTLLGAFIGFLGAVFPEAIKIWRDRMDKQHELAILDRQMEMQKAGHDQRMEAIGAWADVAEMKEIYNTYHSSVGWVEALNGTVRPVLAYGFFLLYFFVKYQQVQFTPWLLWEEDDRVVFAGIISFYFGQRAMQKYRAGRG